MHQGPNHLPECDDTANITQVEASANPCQNLNVRRRHLPVSTTGGLPGAYVVFSALKASPEGLFRDELMRVRALPRTPRGLARAASAPTSQLTSSAIATSTSASCSGRRCFGYVALEARELVRADSGKFVAGLSELAQLYDSARFVGAG